MAIRAFFRGPPAPPLRRRDHLNLLDRSSYRDTGMLLVLGHGYTLSGLLRGRFSFKDGVLKMASISPDAGW